MLKAEHISKVFKDKYKRKINIITDCNLEIKSNQIIGLMGASGCGKSTLARCLLRLSDVDEGSIDYNGQDITNLKQNKLKAFRKDVQFVAQRPETFFDPMMKLGKSLIEPYIIYNQKYNLAMIYEYLSQMRLSRCILDRYPHQVSGGEIQRLSIARALLLSPKILILDEPTSMLDISTQAEIVQLLKSIQLKRKISYLWISHDRHLLNYVCDEILFMKNGKLI